MMVPAGGSPRHFQQQRPIMIYGGSRPMSAQSQLTGHMQPQ